MNKTSISFPQYRACGSVGTLLSAEVVVFQGGGSNPSSLYLIPEGQSVTVPEGSNFLIVDDITVYGELTIYGRAVEVLT